MIVLCVLEERGIRKKNFLFETDYSFKADTKLCLNYVTSLLLTFRSFQRASTERIFVERNLRCQVSFDLFIRG